MKDQTIIIRVTKQMKEDLKLLAKKERRELSDFIRIKLEDEINKKITNNTK
jgi:mRNA-degrading endonuclease RelE of RelBE toxin-antitoxin system